MSHVKFVHWAARMPDSDKLCNNFCATGTNGSLDFGLCWYINWQLLTDVLFVVVAMVQDS